MVGPHRDTALSRHLRGGSEHNDKGSFAQRYGLLCPLKPHAERLTPSPQNETLYGNKVTAGVIGQVAVLGE